jgi:topoisomerase-4 subunit A
MYDRFEPFSKSFVRAIVDDDLQRLTQTQWCITRFDSIKPMILLPN